MPHGLHWQRGSSRPHKTRVLAHGTRRPRFVVSSLDSSVAASQTHPGLFMGPRRLWSCLTRREHIVRFMVVELGTAGRPEAVLGLTDANIDFDKGLIDPNSGATCASAAQSCRSRAMFGHGSRTSPAS